MDSPRLPEPLLQRQREFLGYLQFAYDFAL